MSDQQPYKVERIIEGVEIRRYPPMVLATVREMPDREAFGILFKYISGNNRLPRRKTGERIAMTAPVFSASDSFSFAMPSSYSFETAPVPLDARSVLERIPERRLAALRFSGTAPDKTVAARSRELLDTLERHELRTSGSPFLMRYNAPFTPGFMRRNEVGVELLPAG
jgi:hypothetical protein